MTNEWKTARFGILNSLSKIILFEKLYQEAFDTVSSGEETMRLPCFI